MGEKSNQRQAAVFSGLGGGRAYSDDSKKKKSM